MKEINAKYSKQAQFLNAYQVTPNTCKDNLK